MHGFVRRLAATVLMSMTFISTGLAADPTVVPSGVVHLSELQEQGWSYVRP